MSDIVLAQPSALARLDESADAYEEASRAENTRKTYAIAWRGFEAWCAAEVQQAFPAPPDTVRRYVAWLADQGRRLRSINVACAAIRAQHFDAGLFDPVAHPSVQKVRAGIARTIGSASVKKAALAVAELAAMVIGCPDDERGRRDRALLLVGFAGAFRRGALVALDASDVELVTGGFRVHVRRDKTDQEAKGRTVAIPRGERPLTCPVSALAAWLDVAGRSGPLFVRFRAGPRSTAAKRCSSRLSAPAVALVVKDRARAVGLDPTNLAGHSLRAGFATAAARSHKRLDRIMAQTGHVRAETALEYIREVEMFDEESAARGIGL